ncbi:MAG: hypothetical protein IPK46_18315 [Saprospiraceae bacterium]|nr:hypothetical protein [Saprospiraceae bacterium]
MSDEIVILSDIWGNYFPNYSQLRSLGLNIKAYDSVSLSGIESQGLDSTKLHQQMVSHGIDHAVQKLLQLETEPKNYIGCSVGGLIIWKAALKGLPINNLIAFSSTRLRYEKDSPPCPYRLYFASNDDYRPDESWMQKIGIENCSLVTGGHAFYRDEKLIGPILENWIAKNWFT